MVATILIILATLYLALSIAAFVLFVVVGNKFVDKYGNRMRKWAQQQRKSR